MTEINNQIGAITAISVIFALLAEFIVGPSYDIFGRKIVMLVAYVSGTIA